MEEREERCVSLHNLIVMFRFIQQTFGIQGHNGRKMLEISRVILTILPRLHGMRDNRQASEAEPGRLESFFFISAFL
jgi:hypothetical protein